MKAFDVLFYGPCMLSQHAILSQSVIFVRDFKGNEPIIFLITMASLLISIQFLLTLDDGTQALERKKFTFFD